MKLGHFINFTDSDGDNSKREKLILTVLVVLMLAVVILSFFLPDNGPSTIKKILSEQGYSVDEVEFEKISNKDFGFRERMYQSSVAIEYEGGVLVDKWILSDMSYSNYISNWVVTPYPPPLSEPVNFEVKITISKGQLEALQEKLNGTSIEQYINELLQKTIEEQVE